MTKDKRMTNYAGLVSAMVQELLTELAPIATNDVYKILLERLAQLENAIEIMESQESKLPPLGEQITKASKELTEQLRNQRSN
jgi:hypothetical protein